MAIIVLLYPVSQAQAGGGAGGEAGRRRLTPACRENGTLYLRVLFVCRHSLVFVAMFVFLLLQAQQCVEM